MKKIEGGICAPEGFKASGVCAKIKNETVTKNDCALIVSDVTAAAAGAFTTNVLKSPPAQWTEGVCIRGAARAMFINSGNANACTGQQGIDDAIATAERLALALDAPLTEICVSSTGVIGVPLPMERIFKGVEACVSALSPLGGHDAAVAIMTTDTVPKEIAYDLPLSRGSVRIGAIAKGSGMIAPNMATLIAVITTDANIAAEDLQPLVKHCVADSFNCICIDNDMSTSDTAVCLANGRSGTAKLEPGSKDYDTFASALRDVCIELAHLLVRDGEGATKFVEIQVAGAKTEYDAKTIARSVAHSMLCKTAFFGQDANWGRIACAAGYSGVRFAPDRLSISIEGLEVVRDGLPTVYDEADAAEAMRQKDIHIRISVGDGPGHCTFWTSDLSYDYVKINADYRS